jgi:anti-sigma factor RsiW
MTGCPIWMDALDGRALGDEQSPALDAHLAICPACREVLERRQAVVARMDRVLSGMYSAAEPPPYGPDRIMARIGGRKVAGSFGWRWVAVGSLAVLMLGTILWIRRSSPAANATALSGWRSPTQSLLQPPVGAAWNMMPRLGGGFPEMNLGETHAQ